MSMTRTVVSGRLPRGVAASTMISAAGAVLLCSRRRRCSRGRGTKRKGSRAAAFAASLFRVVRRTAAFAGSPLRCG